MSRVTCNALFAALHANDMKKFHSIMSHGGLPSDSYELLMKALDLNNKPACNLLLDNGCSVNKLGAPTSTPLHMAVRKLGWADVVEKLLNAGAKVTTRAVDGNTALHLAFVVRASERVMELLLKGLLRETDGKDVKNKDGLGFVHVACASLDVDSVKQLFDAGMSDLYSQVSPYSKAPYAGYTPLHFAVENGRNDVAEFLCERSEISVNVQARNGSTPIHLALEHRDPGMIDLLFRYDREKVNYVNHMGLSHFMAACAGSNLLVVCRYLGPCNYRICSVRNAMIYARVKKGSYAGYNSLNIAVEFCRLDTIGELMWRGNCVLTKNLRLKVSCDHCREAIFVTLTKCCRDCKTCLKRIQNCQAKDNVNEVGNEIENCGGWSLSLGLRVYVFIAVVLLIAMLGVCFTTLMNLWVIF